jgi:hypothetical protein
MVDDSKVDNSKLKKKKKKKVKKDNFDQEMIDLINNLRTNPKSLIPAIEEVIQHIKPNPSGKGGDFVFEKEGHQKSSLLRGEPAFRETIEQLLKAKPLPELKFAEDIIVKVPEASAEWTKREIISQLLSEKKKENENKYIQNGFHFDLGTSDPVISLVLQVVDDNNFKGQRRNNLLSPSFKFIGISHKASGKTKFCTYLTFAA